MMGKRRTGVLMMMMTVMEFSDDDMEGEMMTAMMCKYIL